MLRVAVNNQEGELGSNYITDTTLHNPDTGRKPWRSIECIEDCTFSILNDATSSPVDVKSITLVAGRFTFGNFTDIKLGGGKVKAYY